ncbi:MAG: insulinase family protein [Elusimicrobia bacterium]|nr:insulinase family protein [Elusimicrobiota bacterium]
MNFKNGLTAVLKKDTSVPIVSVYIWVKTGSINETPKQAGLSHFIEHLVFKGTKNYPGNTEIMENIENMGGYVNAATSKEYTCFYIDIQKDGYIEAIKMLSDMVTNPLFPEKEIVPERKVVIEEIQRHKDNPHSQLFEKFMTTTYKNAAYKNSIIGTEDVIANIPREEIMKYFKEHYIPSRMVIAVVGDINIKETKKVISETLGQNQNTNPNFVEANIIETADKGNELVTEDKLAHTYMLTGFLGPDMSSKDIYVADVALNVLGSGKSSRLNRILKEEKELVYSISSSFMTLNGTGTAYISAIFDKNNYEKVKDILIQELDKFTNEGPTQEELQKIKINMKSDWLFDLQTFNEQASLMGFWKLFNHLEVFENYLANIEKVTAEDVKNFMKKYYSKEKLSMVVVFPK